MEVNGARWNFGTLSTISSVLKIDNPILDGTFPMMKRTNILL